MKKKKFSYPAQNKGLGVGTRALRSCYQKMQLENTTTPRKYYHVSYRVKNERFFWRWVGTALTDKWAVISF